MDENNTFDYQNQGHPAILAIGTFFLDIVETIVIALAIFVVMYLFLVQPHQVRGASMEPNFQNGEYLLTDKISYRFRDPQRGEVVIFKAPKNPEFDYIKRVVGLPGEHVKIEKGMIYINGKPLAEQYLPREPVFAGQFLQEGQEIILGREEYFVLGDNRNHSSDSRDWGTVTKDGIIGRALLRYWPIKEVGLINKPPY